MRYHFSLTDKKKKIKIKIKKKKKEKTNKQIRRSIIKLKENRT